MQCSKINTHPSKCMILLECLTDHLVPESSPTPSHLPKPRMRIIMFICLWTTLRCICISIGPSPTIDIFLIWTTLRSFLFLDNPSKPFSLDSSHALTPTVLGCPSAYGMHDANSITHNHAYIHIKIKSHNHVM